MHDYIHLVNAKPEVAKLHRYDAIGSEMQLLADSIDKSPEAFGKLDASILRDIAFMAFALALVLDSETIH